MDADPAQLERARQTWGLAIETSAGALSPATLERVFRLLRIKSFEREAFVARLPGIVRRGARVDLEPLAEALAALDVPHALVRRRDDAPAAAEAKAAPRPHAAEAKAAPRPHAAEAKATPRPEEDHDA